jgi:hypothetical protein
VSDSDRVRILPKNLRSAPNSPKVSLGETDGNLGQAMQLAALTGNRPRPLPTLEEEHGLLLKAFRDSEGRDPNPDGDPQFWSAYNTIQKAHTGEAPATVPGDDGDPATDWERLGKAADKTPAWVEEFAARHGETAASLRKVLKD